MKGPQTTKNKGSMGSTLVYGAHLGVVYEVLRSSECKLQAKGISAKSAPQITGYLALFGASKKNL